MYCRVLQNKIKSHLGGNIGKPILDLKIKKRDFLIIEASSYQLSHSKFIKPDYAILLNITNDHLDWHNEIINNSILYCVFLILQLQKNLINTLL